MPDVTGGRSTNSRRNRSIFRRVDQTNLLSRQRITILQQSCALLAESFRCDDARGRTCLLDAGALGIAFDRHEHPAAATVEEAEQHWAGIDAMHFKNLFLSAIRKARGITCSSSGISKRADLRAIADQIGDGKLSFGSPERLMTHLGVTPGSVSPFGLIHDRRPCGPRRDRSRSEIRRPRVVSSEHQHRHADARPHGLRDVSRGVREPGPVRRGLRQLRSFEVWCGVT